MRYIYIIQYSISGSDTKLKDMIKTSGHWFNHFTNSWIIKSNEDISYWQRELEKYIEQGKDKLLIFEIDNIKNYKGWMPNDAWDWLKS